jgi:hypothetical protein
MDNERLHKAALSLLEDEYHSVKIVLTSRRHIEKSRKADNKEFILFESKGATLESSVYQLWQNLRSFQDEHSAFSNYGECWVFYKNQILVGEPIGQLKTLVSKMLIYSPPRTKEKQTFFQKFKRFINAVLD